MSSPHNFKEEPSEPSEIKSMSICVDDDASKPIMDEASCGREIENLMVAGILDEGIPSPPDGGWGWVIVGASFACNLILDACTSSFGVILPLIAADFEVGIGTVAWAGSLLCGISLLVGPIVSSLVNKYECRLVCIFGSIITCLAFVSASLFAHSLPILFLTYGVIGGIGFGCIYLPAIVCVSYYFESKRAVATGLAVSGSGVGAISSAPFVSWLTGYTDWRGVCLLFAGLCSLCGIAGALMRPLQIKIEPLDADGEKEEGNTLFRRLAEQKILRMENGSLYDSEYFMVQLGDGTMERRRKMSLNIDPGVSDSGVHLDQLGIFGSGSDISPVLPSANVDILPTISENAVDNSESQLNKNLTNDAEHRLPESSPVKRRERRISEESCDEELRPFKHFRTLAKEDSAGQFSDGTSGWNVDGTSSRERKYSIRMVPTTSSFGSAAQSTSAHSYNSRMDVNSEKCKFLLSRGELAESQVFRSKDSLSQSVRILRPMSRKDIFFTGSIEHLPEFQSQQSLHSYRQSIINLPSASRDAEDGKRDLRSQKILGKLCPCFQSEVFRITLRQILSIDLLINPVFLIIATSGAVGMLGFYTPIVYGIDFSVKKGISKESSALLMSILGITSIFGRVGFGFLSFLPKVNSLLVNNLCILTMGICTGILPFFDSFEVIAGIYILFGISLSGFIALTSIILVELLGLENLTNAFGLLIFFRGISSIIGPPIAGALYDSTKSYSVPFFFAGGFLICASLISFMAPWATKFAAPKPALQSQPKCTFQLEDILETIESESEEEGTNDVEENSSFHDANV